MSILREPTGEVSGRPESAGRRGVALGEAGSPTNVTTPFGLTDGRGPYELVFEYLQNAIKFGFVPEGARLPAERELAERLGVSRSTVRAVLRALREDEFTVSRTGRAGGTFVVYKPRLTSEEEAARIVSRMGPLLSDALDLRSVLEPGVSALAAERASPADVDRLIVLMRQEREAEKSQRRQFDARLHLEIACIAGSPSLYAEVVGVQARLNELIAFVPMLDVTMRKAERQHEDIVEAIAAADRTRASEAMLAHVSVTADVLLGFSQKAHEILSDSETNAASQRPHGRDGGGIRYPSAPEPSRQPPRRHWQGTR